MKFIQIIYHFLPSPLNRKHTLYLYLRIITFTDITINLDKSNYKIVLVIMFLIKSFIVLMDERTNFCRYSSHVLTREQFNLKQITKLTHDHLYLHKLNCTNIISVKDHHNTYRRHIHDQQISHNSV